MCLNNPYSKVLIAKHFPGALPIHDGLKQENTLLQLLVSPPSEGPRKSKGLEVKQIHHLLVYADDVNFMGDNSSVKRNTEALSVYVISHH
jgi:hypothetical protein